MGNPDSQGNRVNRPDARVRVRADRLVSSRDKAAVSPGKEVSRLPHKLEGRLDSGNGEVVSRARPSREAETQEGTGGEVAISPMVLQGAAQERSVAMSIPATIVSIAPEDAWTGRKTEGARGKSRLIAKG